MNVASQLERHAALCPERVAIRFEGSSITYIELDRASSQLADSLAQRGIVAGDRVVLYLPNLPAFAVAYYAVQKLGAVVVTMSSALKTAEVRFALEDSGAAAIFTTAELSAHVPERSTLKLRASVDEGPAPAGWTGLFHLLEFGSPDFRAAERAGDDNAALLYSSGTTGAPKGVVLTQNNLRSNVALAATCSDVRPNDRIALCLPLFHVYGQNHVMNAAIVSGATIVLFRRFVSDAVLRAVKAERITHFFGVPAIFIGLLSIDLSAYDLSSLRYEMSAAATMPEEISRRWTARFGRPVFEAYGLTECSPLACYNDLHEHRSGSVGRAVPGVEVRIFDEFDREVPAGGKGEIVVRGAGVMKEYWGKPDDTRRALRSGWLHTGDVGTMDEHGFVYIIDRVKDMIDVSGFKVWPAEVEQYLSKLDAIQEVAVYGIPHPQKGEQVVAAVVLREGSQLAADDILAYCRESIASYKIPARIEICESLPKSPTGKLLKRILRENATTPESTDVRS